MRSGGEVMACLAEDVVKENRCNRVEKLWGRGSLTKTMAHSSEITTTKPLYIVQTIPKMQSPNNPQRMHTATSA